MPIPGSGALPSADRLLAVASVRLFAERASLARPGFTLTDANAASVALICRRLDGIPLAIELAAARVAALSPEVLSQRLEHSLALLSRGSRTASPRQQTLTACIDWSYELLDGTERALFRRLSDLPGGTTLDMAETVCAFGVIEGHDVLDLLGSLVDKSLVHVSDRGGLRRYGMLETIRQFGLDELATDPAEAAELEERHRTWWLAHAGDALQAPTVDEAPNVRQVLDQLLSTGRADDALRTVVNLGDWWKTPSLLREALGWAQRGLAAATDPAVRVRAGLFAADLAWQADESMLGLELVEQVDPLLAVDALDDRMTARQLEGMHAWRAGSFERARHAFEQVVSAQRGDLEQAYNMLGLIAYAAADLGAARHWWGELANQAPTDAGTNYARTRLAILDIAEGHWDQAAVDLADLIADAKRSGPHLDGAQEFLARNALADLRSERGDHDGALAVFEGYEPFSGIDRWAEGSTALDCSRAAVTLSAVHRRAGRVAEARGVVEPVLQAMADAGARHAEAWLRCELARIDFASGDMAAADAEARRSIAIYDAIGVDFGWTYSHGVRAEVALARGHTKTAAELERLFIADHPGEERLYGYAPCFERLADVAVAAGSWADAGRLLGAAQALRLATGWVASPERTRKNMGTRSAIEAALGPDEADAAVAAGASMALEDALELARTFPIDA